MIIFKNFEIKVLIFGGEGAERGVLGRMTTGESSMGHCQAIGPKTPVRTCLSGPWYSLYTVGL